MRRPRLLALAAFGGLALGLGLAASAPSAPATTGRVVVASVSGGINPAVADYLMTTIDEASRSAAGALVIELDTPGGLLTSTKDIVSAILNAPIPVVVFVSPRGAWAGSAGTFITLAGHVAAMAPGTSIGAAHPVSALPSGPSPLPQAPSEDGEKPPATRDIAGEKVENFTIAFIESIAEVRKRNVDWAIESVRNSVAITHREALEKNVVDLIADDLDDLLQKIDGLSVALSAENEVTLATADAPIERVAMSALNRFFDVIADPQIALLLILGGMLGLYVEFNQPGLILPGVAGVVCLTLAGLSLQIIPFNWIGLILIFAGMVLMAAEIFVPAFGTLFAAGVVALGIGAYTVFDVPTEMDLSVPFWQFVVPVVGSTALLGGLVVYVVSRSFFRPQFAGVEGLVGDLAIADTDIDPSAEPQGRVALHGEYWTVEASERIPRGERVRIVAVNDLILRVTRSEPSEGG